MTALSWLLDLHKVCHFQSIEGRKPGKASRNELQRWLEQHVLLINGESVKWNEELDFPMISVVLFPKNQKRRTTLL